MSRQPVGWGSREGKPAKPGDVTPAGLLVLVKLDASRAGIEAEDMGRGLVRLRGRDLFAEIPVADACTVLGLILGTRANVHVLDAGKVRVIR